MIVSVRMHFAECVEETDEYASLSITEMYYDRQELAPQDSNDANTMTKPRPRTGLCHILFLGTNRSFRATHRLMR